LVAIAIVAIRGGDCRSVGGIDVFGQLAQGIELPGVRELKNTRGVVRIIGEMIPERIERIGDVVPRPVCNLDEPMRPVIRFGTPVSVQRRGRFTTRTLNFG
jgi:hypothetical protein